MSEVRKSFILGVALLLAVAGSGRVAVLAQSDEERPPIIVDASTIEFSHGHRWRDSGGKRKWKPDHVRGRNAVGYDVIAINKDRESPTVCLASGKDVTIDFTLADKTTHQFRLTLEPHGASNVHDPTLNSPVDLTPVTQNPRRLTLLGQQGQITRVVAGGTTCKLTSPSVQIIVLIQQGQPAARGRRRGDGWSLSASSPPDQR